MNEAEGNQLKKIEFLMNEFSGENAKEHTEHITQFYRSPGSSGIHSATEYAKNKLETYGLDEVRVETYPVDGISKLLDRVVYPAWEPKDVLLKIIEPVNEELVNYEQAPTCIEWFSTPTPPEGVAAEVIDVGSGIRTEDYDGKNVKGRIVFASGGGELDVGVRLYELAVEEHGAIGVVTDYLLGDIPQIRSRESRPDFVGLLRQRRTFDKGWSIVISGTKGTRLRQLLKQGPVKLWARVDTVVGKAEGENLIGVIKGSERPEEEVIVIAHLSATKPAANCASGPAVMIESSRVLMKLIRDGKLPRPRRTIKFLYVCEGLGSSAYLEKEWNQRKNMIGAICLCGVGEDQEQCKSSLALGRTPDSIPSFLNDLSEHSMNVRCGSKLLRSGPMRVAVKPYTPHSDNMVLNLIGVPCVLLHSTPNLYFHTQFLTADKTDPKVLEASGRITTEIAYHVANAGLEEASEIANIVAEASEKRLGRITVEFANELSELAGKNYAEASERYKRRLEYIVDRDLKAIDSTGRLVAGNGKQTGILFNRTLKKLKSAVASKAAEEKKKLDAMRVLVIRGKRN